MWSYSEPLIRPDGHLLPREEGFISPGEVVETVILDKEAIRAEWQK
jgi:hypothetical protein